MKLNMYYTFKSFADWKDLKVFVKKTKRFFFDEIVTEALQFNRHLCIKL